MVPWRYFLDMIEVYNRLTLSKADYSVYSVRICVLVTQSCPTLWNPTDCSLPRSSVHGILQTRMAAKSLQSCPTLCDPIDGSPPGSPIPGILQARTLEWAAISFSNAWKWEAKVKSLSRAQLLATPWTAAHQAPPPMGFSRQEYWSGCHCLLHSLPIYS